MLTLEIAGQKVTYKNAPDLNQKVRAMVQEIHARRSTLDTESKELRKQEHTLAKFLGGSKQSLSADSQA